MTSDVFFIEFLANLRKCSHQSEANPYALVNIYIYMCVPITSQHSKDTLLLALWLMSSALVGPALEVVREVRYWFTSPSGCPVFPLVLVAICLGTCCFCIGLCTGCLVVSQRCRNWLWHCVLGAQELWLESRAPTTAIELRRRLRSYRA